MVSQESRTDSDSRPPTLQGSSRPVSPARWAIVGASLVILAAGMHAAATLVNAVVLTVLLATVLVPLLRSVRRLGLPAWLATTVVVVPVLGLGALLVGFLMLSLGQIYEQVPRYALQLSAIAEQLSLAWWGDAHQLAALVDSFAVRPDQVVQPATAAIVGLLDACNNLLLVLFLLLYLCADAERLPARLGAALGADHPLFARLKALNDGLRDYMLINGVIGIVVALARTGLLLTLGVDFAGLWGVWSLLLTYVPTVGYPLALLPPAVIAFIQHGWESTALVVAGFGVINVVAYNMLMPRYQGRSLDLSPFVIVVSLIFWGIILGAMGALLAVPLTLVLRTILESSEQTRWLADLMTGESSGAAGSTG
jgi:predicted PurR-regulated permease PerM